VVIVQLLRDLMDQKRLELGLLAGLADPRLAKAINAMHADPARGWSLEALATVAGMSRAHFAVRFRETVGLTHMAYLSCHFQKWSARNFRSRVHAPLCRAVVSRVLCRRA
jgi:transcriptional regulator GlxA family with amidase domain